MDMQEPHLLSGFIRGMKRIMPGAIVSIVVLGVIAFFWIPSQTVLVVRTVKPEKTVLCARMIDREEWTSVRPVPFRRLWRRDAGDLHAGESSPCRAGWVAGIHG